MTSSKLIVLSMLFGAFSGWSVSKVFILSHRQWESLLFGFLAVVAAGLSLLFLWILTLHRSPLEGVTSLLRHLFYAGKSSAKGMRYLRELKASWKNPRSAQEQFLMKILNENGDTLYGRKFNLKSIASVDEFRHQHPLTTYGHYKPYVERVMSGEPRVMTEVMPKAIVVSSGTTGTSKNLPQRDQRASLHHLFDTYMAIVRELCPNLGLLQKTAYFYVQPVISRAKWGGSVRSVMSLYYDEDYAQLASCYATPPEGFRIRSLYQANYVHLMFALLDHNLGVIMGVFIDSIVGMMGYLENEWMNIVNDIERGTINPDKVVFHDPNIRSSLLRALGKGQPKRAGKLRREFEKGFDCTIMKRVWPNLQVLAAGENSGRWPQIKAKYAKGVTFVNMGYGCSEALTLALSIWRHDENPSMVLTPNLVFFEFIKQEDMKESQPETLLLDEVEVGKEYELVFTTNSGLYRYRVGDVVRITGYYQKCPTIEFMYRIGLILNLHYEKITQVLLKRSLESAVGKLKGFNLVEYAVTESTLIPTSSQAYEADDIMPYYVMFLQLNQDDERPIKDSRSILSEITISIDGELRDGNCDYKRLRREGIISLPRVHIVKPGTFDALKQHIVSTTNTTSNQYKIPRKIRSINTLNFMYEHIL